jgi:hypothetical protein
MGILLGTHSDALLPKGSRREGHYSAQLLATQACRRNARRRRSSFAHPSAPATPEATSRPDGRKTRTASPTFSGFKPPARNQRPGGGTNRAQSKARPVPPPLASYSFHRGSKLPSDSRSANDPSGATSTTSTTDSEAGSEFDRTDWRHLGPCSWATCTPISRHAAEIASAVSSTNTPTGVAPASSAAAAIPRAVSRSTDRLEPGQTIIPSDSRTEGGISSRNTRATMAASSRDTMPHTLTASSDIRRADWQRRRRPLRGAKANADVALDGAMLVNLALEHARGAGATSARDRRTEWRPPLDAFWTTASPRRRRRVHVCTCARVHGIRRNLRPPQCAIRKVCNVESCRTGGTVSGSRGRLGTTQKPPCPAHLICSRRQPWGTPLRAFGAVLREARRCLKIL